MMKCNFPTDSLYENSKLCDDYNKGLSKRISVAQRWILPIVYHYFWVYNARC